MYQCYGVLHIPNPLKNQKKQLSDENLRVLDRKTGEIIAQSNG